jgi:hypothetical protein
MATKISSLETDFTKCLELIVKQSKVSNKASQQHLEATETLQVTQSKQILEAFEATQAQANQAVYKQILEAFEATQAQANQAVQDVNELCIKLKECEVHDNALCQMVLSIYNAMATENKVPSLSQAMTDIITQASQTMNAQDTKNMDVDTHEQSNSQTKQTSEGHPKEGSDRQ